MYGGVGDIKKMKYFSMTPLEWASMAAKDIPSPYCPKVKHAGDTDNFDKYEEEDIRWYGNGADKHGDIFAAF
jgi:hypothetical protein